MSIESEKLDANHEKLYIIQNIYDWQKSEKSQT